MTIGENIKRLRLKNNQSQEQLAEAVDVTRQSVSKWETGRANPDMDKLVLLAHIFEVSLNELTETAAKEDVYENQNVQQKLKKKVRVWRTIAILLMVLLAGGAGTGTFLVCHFYPQAFEKIGIKLAQSEDCKQVVFEHNNLYTDGIDGILSDLGEAIDFPQYLMMTTSFDLRFAPDGTVSSLDTMWCGYDERYTYVDSYLITYDAGKSDKISVYFGGGTGDSYDANKDMTVLFDAMRLIPYEETVRNWNQPEYGILYKGIRSWGYNGEGIRYLDRKGKIDIPSDEIFDEIKGPTVSVYCTKDETVTPVRYLFCENNVKERNVN